MIKDAYGNPRFYGIYRGVVQDNKDPLGKFRVKLQVPQVLSDAITEWAWPIAPTSNTAVATPAIGDGVFVAFEGGDPSYPLWSGLFNGTLVSAVGTGSVGPAGPMGPSGEAVVSINTVTGTSYTLVAEDAGKLVSLSNSSSVTLTVPTDSVSFAVGSTLSVIQAGTGQVTVTATSPAVVNGTPGKKLRAQFSGASLIKVAANSWVIMGDTTL